MDKYILKDRNPVVCDSLEKWAQWFEHHAEERKVGKTTVSGVFVSTVFIGLDHSFGNGKPIVFETIAFGRKNRSLAQERYSTWAEAEAGHKKMVEAFTLKNAGGKR